MSDIQYPDALYDEDGRPVSIAVDMAGTAKEAVRHHFELEYDDLIDDMFGSGRIPLSWYRSFVADVRRVWMVKYRDWHGDDIWWERDSTVLYAREYWRIPI